MSKMFNIVSRCEEGCYSRAGCVVLNESYIRNFSCFLNTSEDEVNKDKAAEQVFFPVPSSVQIEALQKMMNAIPNEMIRKPNDDTWNLGKSFEGPTVPFKLQDLAKAAEIPFGYLDDCYLVRYKDPGNFHIILDQGDYLKGATWNKHFSAESGLNIQSGLGLYRALIFLLSRCMSCNKSRTDDNIYRTGDLVICAVSRQLPSSSSGSTITMGVFGYRGVVIKENVEVISFNADKDRKMTIGKKVPALLVYLLDTGEERLVEKGVGYLTPLPEAFTGFPSLAVPCALHGVSPAGNLWDSHSRQKMRELVCTKENASGEIKLLVEFFSKYRSEQHGEIWKLPPYFVELTACFDGLPSSRHEQRPVSESGVLVSSILIKNGLAVEWNFTPRKAKFCKEIFRPVDLLRPDAEGKSFQDDEIPEDELNDIMDGERRGILLHLVGKGNPAINPKMSEEQCRFEIMNAFVANRERLDRQIIQFEDNDDFEGNILSMRINIREGQGKGTLPTSS